MSTTVLNIICVAYERPILLRVLVYSFLAQTSPLWRLKIIHDGPASPRMRQTFDLPEFKDDRIKFIETSEKHGKWGHPNRKLGVQSLTSNRREFVLITNDDNYYVPTFVEKMLSRANRTARLTGMVYCDTLHNYTGYKVLHTKIKRGQIDMGSFIVRNDVAKKVGFNYEDIDADGMYAEECARYCSKCRLNLVYIPRALFVHN